MYAARTSMNGESVLSEIERTAAEDNAVALGWLEHDGSTNGPAQPDHRYRADDLGRHKIRVWHQQVVEFGPKNDT